MSCRAPEGGRVRIRRESPEDAAAIREVTAAAFRTAPHSAPPVEPGGDPGEATLVEWLRADVGWIPDLSLVATEGEGEGARIVGHVLATRAYVGDDSALGLGPLSVVPDRQGAGIGSALVRALLDAADTLGEPLIGLVGDPGYYRRFGFVPAESAGITAPDEHWGEYFQVRALTAYGGQRGVFRYAEPFSRF